MRIKLTGEAVTPHQEAVGKMLLHLIRSYNDTVKPLSYFDGFLACLVVADRLMVMSTDEKTYAADPAGISGSATQQELSRLVEELVADHNKLCYFLGALVSRLNERGQVVAEKDAFWEKLVKDIQDGRGRDR